MSILFTIITAIATGATAVATFMSFKNEREKRRLNIFSESARSLLDGIKNSESIDYIVSYKYNKDVELVKFILGISVTDMIGLDDYKKIVIHNLSKDGQTITASKRQELRKAYKKIKYVCDKMEYVGIMAEDQISRDLIIGYLKYTILETYSKLEPIIKKTRIDQKDETLYKHYTQLYLWANKNG